VDGGADQVRLDADVHQSRDRRGGVVGVQGGEHQVSGEGGLDGDPGGFGVADFAQQHDVGVLTEQAAQRRGEGHADLVVHLRLVGGGELVLDRVFDRADVQLVAV